VESRTRRCSGRSATEIGFSSAEGLAFAAAGAPTDPAGDGFIGCADVADDAANEGDGAGGGATYEFSPNAEALLADMLPATVKTQLFQCFNDAVVSEQIMRMVAMKAATENARDLKKSLNRQFNRARQAQITTELTEIISGAAALE